MKKLVLIAFLFFSLASYAQVDLVGYGGYQFGSKTYWSSNTNLKIKGDANYGVALEISMAPDVRLQLQWMGSSTYSQLETYNGFIPEGPDGNLQRADVNINYYQIGVLRPYPLNDKVEAFGNFTLGATQFALQSYTYNDEWRFSITAGLGVNIWLTEMIGLRGQVRLLAPINWAGLGFYCGTGGCGSGVNAGSTMASGDVSGGLIIRLRE